MKIAKERSISIETYLYRFRLDCLSRRNRLFSFGFLFLVLVIHIGFFS